MATVVITGFPGFLASAFLPSLFARLDPSTSVTCLVQPQFRSLAERRAAELAASHSWSTQRIRLVEGDITQPNMGLPGGALGLEPETRELYHFAAVYDLAVPRPLGMKVNVDGTRHVLDFIESCSHFERLHYVSTCYVSGRFPGTFSESDLTVDQVFNNYYEETKYLAEVEVQKRMQRGLRATIYRPAIVVGDSTTGATQKYDGPYGALRWVLRWKKTAPILSVGGTTRFHVNLVPRDFVVAAIGRLSALSASSGLVYQLCDPSPPTVAELYDVFRSATGRKILPLPLPATLAKATLKYIPGFGRSMNILPESIDYFTHPTRYTCDNTLRDLQGSGIVCPPFRDYASVLVRFVKEHPEIGAGGMY